MLKVLARAFFAAYLLCSTGANASWPDRPVTLIVPYAAGGITDVLARLTAEHLQRTFKQSFIIQNETGAGGIIGAANAARAKPDGYTLFFAPIALLTLSPLTTKVNFATSDFEPISIVASSPFVVTVGKDFPASSPSHRGRRPRKWRRRSPPICSAGVRSQTTLHRKNSKRVDGQTSRFAQSSARRRSIV